MAIDKTKLKKFLPIGIGVVLSLVIISLVFGAFGGVFTRASNVKPEGLSVTEITENSAKVTWKTNVETQSTIEYGTSQGALNFFAPDLQQTNDHSIELTLLSPSTTYYFVIRDAEDKYDQNGKIRDTSSVLPWSFTTKGTEATPTLAPTATPTVATPVPTSAVTPTTGAAATCTETDCEAIKAKLGKGCSTQDYFKCVKKLTPTP